MIGTYLGLRKIVSLRATTRGPWVVTGTIGRAWCILFDSIPYALDLNEVFRVRHQNSQVYGDY